MLTQRIFTLAERTSTCSSRAKRPQIPFSGHRKFKKDRRKIESSSKGYKIDPAPPGSGDDVSEILMLIFLRPKHIFLQSYEHIGSQCFSLGSDKTSRCVNIDRIYFLYLRLSSSCFYAPINSMIDNNTYLMQTAFQHSTSTAVRSKNKGKANFLGEIEEFMPLRCFWGCKFFYVICFSLWQCWEISSSAIPGFVEVRRNTRNVFKRVTCQLGRILHKFEVLLILPQ